MSPPVLLGATVTAGEHWSAHFFGQTVFLDTVVSSLVAFGVVLGAGLYLRRVLTAGVPGRFQALIEMVWETVDDYVRRMIGPFAMWAVPLCTTLFFYILVSNWLELVPTQDRLTSATADINDTGAMAIIVILLVHFTSIRQRGFKGYLKINYLHPPGMSKFFYVILIPVNVISQLSYPLSLSLRLFGNMFAAALMLEIIALMPIYAGFFFNGVWKLFEGLFVDVVQAFIFALLTLIYLSLATTETEESEPQPETAPLAAAA
ncbi:MAG: F0F1 ATP synthase subunit A [Candidatus Dormibacteria bacterium]